MRLRAFAVLAGAVAIVSTGSVAEGATRFQERATGAIPGFGSSEVPDDVARKLLGATWSRTDEAVDVTLDLKLTAIPDGSKGCASLTTVWWDGEQGRLDDLCVTKPFSLTGTVPIQKRDVLSGIVEPIATELLREEKARWMLRLNALDPAQRSMLEVKVGGNDATTRIAWDTQGGTLSVGNGHTAALRYGQCQAEVTERAPSMELSQLSSTRTFEPRWTMDGASVTEVVHGKDEPFELGLELVPATGGSLVIPCDGEVSAILPESANEFAATSVASAATRWTWKVTTKAGDGSLLVHLRSAHAVDPAGTSATISFHLPWWQQLWVAVLGIAGGVLIVARAVKAVRDAFRGPKANDSPKGADADDKDDDDDDVPDDKASSAE